MDQRVTLITLGVRDLERARGFYERLGWKRSMKKAEGVAFFQVGSLGLALWPREDLAKDMKQELADAGIPRVSLALNVRTRAEVDGVLAEAVAAGATLLKPGTEAFWGGYTGYFCDPEGFAWEVAWNPGFTLAADGSVTLPE
jgi:predicted lactoylglutathione lyase